MSWISVFTTRFARVARTASAAAFVHQARGG